ncbi:MAG: co-chaperone GroES [Candidatus Omnitrophica bacterium]|nr:co-chaperone GroES [Candidatus Omnitrophota bacterium]
MKIQPLGDRIMVEVLEAKERTKSGIVLPDTAKEKPQEAKVIAVGKGKVSDEGKVIPPEVKAGDTVLFGKYSGTEIAVDEKEYLILKEEDILAIISSK